MRLDQLSSLVRLGRRTKVRPLAVFILDEFKGRLVGPIFGGGCEKNRADIKATDFFVGPIFFKAAAKNRAYKSHRVNRP